MSEAEKYLEAAMALQGMTLAPEWQAGALAYFEAIAKAAALVLAVPLDDETEAAPVFTP